MARKLSAIVEIGASLASSFEKAFGTADSRIKQFGSSLSGFRKAEQDIKGLINAQSALKTAQERNNKELKEYNSLLRLKNMKRNEADQKRYNANVEAQRKRVEDSGRALKRQKKQVAELGSTLRKAGVDTNNLGRSQKQLALRSEDARRRMKMLQSIQGLPLGEIGGRLLPALMMKFPKFGEMVAKIAPTIANALPILAEFGMIIGAVGIAVGALAYGIFKIGMGFSNWVDDIKDASEGLGMTLKGLMEFRAVANDAGISAEKFDVAMQRMQVSIQSAVDSSGNQRKALEALGLDAVTLQAMNAEEQFLTIANAFQNYSGSVSKATLGNEIFGRGASRLIGVLNKGEQGIKEFGDRARKSGLIPSDEELAKAEELDRAYRDFEMTLTSLRNTIGAELVPVLKEFFGEVKGYITSHRDELKSWAKGIGTSLLMIVKSLPEIIKLAEIAILPFQGLLMILKAIAKTIDYITGTGSDGKPLFANAFSDILGSTGIGHAVAPTIFDSNGNRINYQSANAPTQSSSNGTVYNQDIKIMVSGTNGMDERTLAEQIRIQLQRRATQSGGLYDGN